MATTITPPIAPVPNPTHRFYLQSGADVDATILAKFPQLHATAVSTPLSDSQAQALLGLTSLIDLQDAHPGDGIIEYDVPHIKGSTKIFGLSITEEIDIELWFKIIDHGPNAVAAPTA